MLSHRIGVGLSKLHVSHLGGAPQVSRRIRGVRVARIFLVLIFLHGLDTVRRSVDRFPQRKTLLDHLRRQPVRFDWISDRRTDHLGSIRSIESDVHIGRPDCDGIFARLRSDPYV